MQSIVHIVIKTILFRCFIHLAFLCFHLHFNQHIPQLWREHHCVSLIQWEHRRHSCVVKLFLDLHASNVFFKNCWKFVPKHELMALHFVNQHLVDTYFFLPSLLMNVWHKPRNTIIRKAKVRVFSLTGKHKTHLESSISRRQAVVPHASAD